MSGDGHTADAWCGSLCWLIGGTAAGLFLVWSLHEWREGRRGPNHASQWFFVAIFGGVMPFGVLSLHMLVRSGPMWRRLLLGLLTTYVSYCLFAFAKDLCYGVPMSMDLKYGTVLRFSLEGLYDWR